MAEADTLQLVKPLATVELPGESGPVFDLIPVFF